MKTQLFALVGAAFCISQAAHAVEVTGGSVGLSYSAFVDETDFNHLGIEGSVELGWTRNWATQFDLAHDRFDASGVDTITYGVHGIYHMNDATSFGLFYSVEDGDGDSIDIFGLEAGHEFSNWDVEGYLGRADDGAADADMYGVMGRTELENGFGFAAEYRVVDFGNGVDIERLSVSLDRDVSANTNLYLEVGTSRLNVLGVSGSEPFIGVGGTYRFGAERGATFGVRNVLGILPGG